LAAERESGPVLLVDSTIGEISHAAFADADVRLEEVFETKVPGKYELKGNIIIAICSPAEAEQIKGRLNDAKALAILSRPKLVTANRRTASIRVGSEIPMLTTQALVDDHPPSEIKYQFEGIALDVSPYITFETQDQDKRPTLRIEGKAELSKRHPGNSVPAQFNRRELKFKSAIEPGQVLVVVEREPQDKVKDKQTETLYLQLTVQPATPETLKTSEAEATKAALMPSPHFERRNILHDLNQAASLQALRAENAALKAEVQAFRAHHVQLIEQIEKERLDSQSRREAAPGTQSATSQPTTLRIYRLRNMQAEKARELVADQAAENKQQLKLSTDERSNSLIITGDTRAHELAAALLNALDDQPAADGNPFGQPLRPNPPADTVVQPAPEIEKQLRELEVLEAEAVLATVRSKLERLQQMHKTGQVSVTELLAAETAAKTAAVNVELARRPNDPRFHAEAQLQLAEARLDAAKKEFDRATQQSKAGTISAEEVSSLELEFRRAEIAVRRAKLQLDAVQKNTPRTK
jgi:hypothetical protein